MTEGPGHNGQLRAFVERIESVEVEIRERQEDRKEIYSEAKGSGFDPAIIRQIVRERREDAQKRAEREELLETYRRAIGG